LGCKVNLADAAGIVDLLDDADTELVDQADQADVVLLNTCTVTHKADRDVRKILGGLARRWPELPVVVTGCGARCWAERLAAFANVIAVIPPNQPRRVAEALGAIGPAGPRRANGVSAFARLHRRRAFAKVQDGCNAHCTYCIVPRARGPQRSLGLADACDKIGGLLEAGHGEVVLTGIHLGRYGADLQPPVELIDLLEAVAPWFAEKGPVRRLRLSSIEPLEWSARLLAGIERMRFVCRHFHVPLQSGDDGVLASMARPYRAAQYERVIQALRRLFPQAALGADVLVGFPGEDAAAFGRTMGLVERLDLSYLHVFTFSARPGTRAAALPDRVPPEVVRERSARLRSLGREKWLRFVEQGRGRRHRVLVERRIDAGWEGRSEHYHRVRLARDGTHPGQIVEVLAAGRMGDWLLADELARPAEAACQPA
jgi:threonylcarbamoyladenosine tRNA methylthiotransferase MtaB